MDLPGENQSQGSLCQQEEVWHPLEENQGLPILNLNHKEDQGHLKEIPILLKANLNHTTIQYHNCNQIQHHHWQKIFLQTFMIQTR